MSTGFIIHEDWNIVAIATIGTANVKTGDMLQIWIMDRNLHPVESVHSRKDAKLQCKGCPFASGNGCYVSPLPLMAIWRKFQRGEYPTLEKGSISWDSLFSGKSVRFGAYGNPSMLPLAIVEDIAKRAKKHTGYFHDWHSMEIKQAQDYGRFFMASCEKSNVKQAQGIGLRTFMVVPELEEFDGIECLADSKGLTCSECGLCDGTERSNQRAKALPSVFIKAHGFKVNKAKEHAI